MGDTKNIEGVKITKQSQTDDLVIWKPNIPITEVQQRLIGRMLRNEEKETGIRIMLIPFSVDAQLPQKTQKKAPTEKQKE